jgi:hypothetical protein
VTPESTDRAQSRREEGRHAVVIALGALVVVLPYLLEYNDNQVFLLLVLVSYVTIAVVLRRTAARAVLLAVCIILAWFPAEIPEAKMVDPGPVDRNQFTQTIPLQRRWRYTFTLRDIAQRHPECGQYPASGIVYVDGTGLDEANLRLEIEGAKWLKPPELVKSGSLDQLRLTPDLAGVREFSIMLSAKPGGSPALRLGPESSGMIIYSDSVFLEFKDDKCTVIHETRRAIDVLP